MDASESTDKAGTMQFVAPGNYGMLLCTRTHL